jgi:glycosyltransferase involved in cell wall biosynthesis
MSKATIAFLTYDWSWGTQPLQPNGCAWYRCLLPSREMKKYEWGTGMGFPGFNEQYGFGLMIEDTKAIHGFDIIVFKLIMHQKVLDSMDEAKRLGQVVVVDIDDWHDGLSPTNRAYAATDPKNNPENNRDIYAQIIAKADAVITSTPFLAAYYAQKHPNVYMVRNGIDIGRWKRRVVIATDKPTIGWVGATPWRSGDIESVANSVGKFVTENKLPFHHSGHTPDGPSVADQLEINPENITTLPLVPILDYPKLFTPIDIGIVPLSDIQFNHAKSFIKGLEYAAAGIPFIASYSPEYEYLAELGIGRVAHNEKEWEYHLNELMDIEMRRDEATVNLENLHKFATMDIRGKDWDSAYSSIYKEAFGEEV